MMKNRIVHIHVLTTLLLLLSLGSCTGEMDDEDNTGQKQNIVLTINTRATGNENGETQDGTSEENKISNLLVIVYKVESNGQANTQIAHKSYGENTRSVKLEFPKHDQIKVLLIANGKTSWQTELEGESADDIKNHVVNYSVSDLTTATPFLMFGESENINGQKDQSISMSLIRNLARVDLSLSCTFAEMTDKIQNGDKLELESVCMYNMAPKGGLGTPILNVDITTQALNGSKINLNTGSNYQSDDKGFSLGTPQMPYITFYVPEHYVTNTSTYTYIYVTGKYTTQSGQSNSVVYKIPVGNQITSAKISGKETFTASDLCIERNNLYRMSGTLNTVQQINDIHVSVLPWTNEAVNGTITKPEPAKLNVSDLKVKLDVNDKTGIAIQFWSDQKKENIRVLPQMTIKSTKEVVEVNKIFTTLANEKNSTEHPDNIQFEEGTDTATGWSQWGRLKVQFQPKGAVPGETYIITLAAGSIQRSIEITATEKE